MLRDLLELMHTSASRWSTLRATITEWTDHEALEAAADDWCGLPDPEDHPPGLPSDPNGPGVLERELTVVARSPLAVRFEAPDGVPGPFGERARLVIIAPDGGSLTIEAGGTARSEPDRRLSIGWLQLGAVAPMLAPDMLLGDFRLEPAGTVTVTGRACIAAVAQLRGHIVENGLGPLGQGVEQAEFAVDRATGLLLRLRTAHRGRPVQRLEMRDLALNEPVPDDTFSITPPDAFADRTAEPGSLTFANAARTVPFTLLAPRPRMDRPPWLARVCQSDSGARSVHLHPVGVSMATRPPITLIEAAEPTLLPDVAGWQPVGIAGDVGHAWLGTPDGDGVHLVLWRDGTGVWLQHATALEEAVELMQSLEPVAGN